MERATDARPVKVALLCSGLGRVLRGHEAFASGLFELLKDSVDITLFQGGGTSGEQRIVIDHLPRDTPCLDKLHLPVSAKWLQAAVEEERFRVECRTFAYASLKPLLEGDFDVIHCLEQAVCNIVYQHRHLFARTPTILFSNGGAIAARDLPACDYVQEHTAYNLSRSARRKAFLIPHGVDLRTFDPAVPTDFRARHGIPAGARLLLSVGTISHRHKRMDHVIREAAEVPELHLAIVGQEAPDSEAIRQLGKALMGSRIVFDTLPHAALPAAYAAADVFTLGSLFETFGIVYIEAMAMGVPIVCTQHANQRAIVEHGVFIDMSRKGALTEALRQTSAEALSSLARLARQRVIDHYDLNSLKRQYAERFKSMAARPRTLPKNTALDRLASNARNALRRMAP